MLSFLFLQSFSVNWGETVPNIFDFGTIILGQLGRRQNPTILKERLFTDCFVKILNGLGAELRGFYDFFTWMKHLKKKRDDFQLPILTEIYFKGICNFDFTLRIEWIQILQEKCGFQKISLADSPVAFEPCFWINCENCWAKLTKNFQIFSAKKRGWSRTELSLVNLCHVIISSFLIGWSHWDRLNFVRTR